MKPLRTLGLLAAAAAFGLFLSTNIVLAGADNADDGLRPSPSGSTDQNTKKRRSQSELRDGYLQARALILGGQYKAGITALRALDYDDSPDVANYLGYASRKLGDYEKAKYWYEKALASDPNHVRTWQYYGMLHVERGNMLKAADHLEKIKALCGTECKEYADLKSAMEGHVRY